MIEFAEFAEHEPISARTIARYADAAPEGAVEMWRAYGAGDVGADRFVRVVDPARAATMLEGVVPLPDDAVPMFTTALADLIVWYRDTFLVYMLRRGALFLAPRTLTLDHLAELLQDPQVLDGALERGPFLGAVARDGLTTHEQCYGFVPLLALGGSASPDHLQLMGLYEHMALIVQLAGMPQPVGMIFDEAG